MVKIYRQDGKLWAGEYITEKGYILMHPTEDVSEKYKFPRSFLYSYNEEVEKHIDTLKEMENLEVFAVNYKVLIVSIDGKTLKFYIKIKDFHTFLEDKCRNCRNPEDYSNFIKTYGMFLF